MGLPKKAFDLFDQSIQAVDLLVHFSGISFDERRVVFENLFFKGLEPNQSEVALYEQYFAQPHSSIVMDAEKYMTRVLKCFKNLKLHADSGTPD